MNTNLELLRRIDEKDYLTEREHRKFLDRLNKDLEVLEQLKEILSMNYLVRVYGYDMANRLQTYLKSNDAVKRWLDE